MIKSKYETKHKTQRKKTTTGSFQNLHSNIRNIFQAGLQAM